MEIYFQGMNILCAPFLYVMSEEDAYIAFSTLLTKHCPRYVAPQLVGVHAACILADRCLQYVNSSFTLSTYHLMI